LSTKLHKNTLYEKATETVFGFIITTILSLGLISGGSYILFGYQTELEKLEEIRAELKVINEESETVYNMMVIANSMPPTPEQMEIELGTISILKENVENQKLDENFIGYTMEWCTDLISDLASAKGAIKGFYFEQDSEFESTRALLISNIEANISVTQAIKSLVANWESLEPTERNLRVGEIESLVTGQAETMESAMSHTQQMMKRSELKINELNDLKANSDRAYKSYVIKRILSVVGITLGGFMLIWFSNEFFFASNKKNRVESKNDVKQKSKKSSKNGG